jgi:site-specific recombinase XerD
VKEPVLPKDPANPSPTFGAHYEKEVYTPEEVRALLNANPSRSATATRNRALIATLWQSGLRITEALDLRPEDFDLDRSEIHVRHGKGDKARRVQTGPDAVEAVRTWLVTRASVSTTKASPLFCTLQGGKQKSTYVRGMLQRQAAKAHWTKRIHPHGFRHTFAVNLARNGVPVPMIQRQLGHDSLATTSVYLSAISTDDVRDAMATVEW